METILIVVLLLLYAFSKAQTDTEKFRDRVDSKWHIWNTISFLAFGGAWGLVFREFPGFLAVSVGVVAWWLAQRPFEGFYSWFKTGKWYGQQTRTIPVEWMPDEWRTMFSEMTGLQIKWNQIRLEGNQAKIADGVRIILGALFLWILIT